MSIEKLKANYPVRTKWLHFPLHPETPPEGVLMKDLYRNRDRDQVKATGDYLRAQMAEGGLEYNKRTYLDNSRLAQELGAWADTQENSEAFHDAMYRAYFVDDKRLSDRETLLEIVDSLGMDTTAAEEVLTKRTFSDQVQKDWDRAWQEGVTGVPTFTSRDLFVFGCQPYEVLERFYNHLVKLRAEDAAES